MLLRRIERAVAVVVADRVGGRQQHEPAGVEQRREPRVVLPRHRHRSRDRQRHRQALPDRLVEQRPHAPQVRAAEGGEAVLEQLVERLHVGDGPRLELALGALGAACSR
jgi:hypothetical protein